MYCGRELEKSEKCNCAGSVQARRNRDGQTTDSGNNRQQNDGTYKAEKVNYQKKEKKQKRDWKGFDFKSKAQKARAVNSFNNGRFWLGFINLVKSFLKNPVYTALNPAYAGKYESILLVGIMGIVLSLVVFFSTGNISRNIFSMLSRVIGFKGTQGFAEIGNMILNMITVTAFSYIQFFILSGIFYLIQKYVLRLQTKFWDIAVRFAMSAIPMIFVGLIGIVISLFSMQTVLFMLAGTMIVSIAIMYEVFKDMWQPLMPDRIVYIMAGGYFVYFSLCFNLLMRLLRA